MSATCWLSAGTISWAKSIINQQANSGLLHGATEYCREGMNTEKSENVESQLSPKTLQHGDNASNTDCLLAKIALSHRQSICGLDHRKVSMFGGLHAFTLIHTCLNFIGCHFLTSSKNPSLSESVIPCTSCKDDIVPCLSWFLREVTDFTGVFQ